MSLLCLGLYLPHMQRRLHFASPSILSAHDLVLLFYVLATMASPPSSEITTEHSSDFISIDEFDSNSIVSSTVSSTDFAMYSIVN
jgi:hypothetical protein